MARMRKPFQGVANIVRFNWHFFALALIAAAAVAWASSGLEGNLRLLGFGFIATMGGMMLVSLCVSFYIYDASGLYELAWLDSIALGPGGAMLNIHAGLDETTPILRERYPEAEWTVLDFYNPAKHTEVSIQRARKLYPPSPDDLRVDAAELPVAAESIDAAFVLLAAHEIREVPERHAFFRELHRVLKPGGRAVILEHLRDGPNFCAYAVGAFHFMSQKTWLTAFEQSRLRIARTIKPNPFMTCFILERNESTP